MGEVKHAPWTSQRGDGINVRRIVGAGNVWVADADGSLAPLIQAAPEMCEALEPFGRAAEIIRPDLPDDTVIQLRIGEHAIYHVALSSLREARAALAKAEGQS